MNELQRTMAFVTAAVVITAAAVGVSYRSEPEDPDQPGKNRESVEYFFDEFDPSKAANLKITEVDPKSGNVNSFQVKLEGGRWVLPSHANYPADAKARMADVAKAIGALEKGPVAGNSKNQHGEVGVLNPTEGVTEDPDSYGKLVTLLDASDNPLAEFILGKAEDSKRPRQRFVRLPKQDRVYRIDFDPAIVSTVFADWIEKDLLQLNPFDVREVTLDDYRIEENRPELVAQGAPQFSLREENPALKLVYHDKDGKWTTADGQGPELDSEKLQSLRNALDALRIIDVGPKPKGLKSDLSIPREIKDADFMAVFQALGPRGFIPDQNGRVRSNEGEVHVGTSEGVRYTLLFGSIATDVKTGSSGDGEASEGPQDAGVHRHILVAARFDKNLISKPQELIDLEAKDKPPAPEGEPGTGEQPPAAEGEKLPDEGEKQPAGEGTKEPSEDAAPKGDSAPKSGEVDAENLPPGAEGAAAVQQPADAPSGDEQPAEKAGGENAADDKAVGDKAAGEAGAATGKTAEDRRIERRRKELEEQHEAKIKAGKKKVKELNDRLGGWYYVISDAEYKKIHLTRGDVFKKVEKPLDDGGLGDKDELKELPREEEPGEATEEKKPTE